ncbi:hypothetical protein Godav_011736, partial [Gossypium davidsonii]|nr:hypothetical protein [Gossypium davidsonii]
CPRRQLAVEDLNHVFCFCAYVKDVWAILQYVSPTNSDQMDFHQWLSWMFDTYIMIKRSEIAITIWALWYTRNKLVHEGTNQGVGELIVFIRSYCTELATLTSDVGFVFAQRKACSGVIIHDAYGQNLGACSRLTNSVSSVFAAKELAVIHGLQFALEIGSLLMILEYIGQSGNRAAHVMAHDGLLQGEDYFWVEEAPDPVVVVAAEKHCLVKPP